LLERVGTFNCLLDVFDALIAKAGEHDKCGHRNLHEVSPQAEGDDIRPD
jgi:hypothetical protein